MAISDKDSDDEAPEEVVISKEVALEQYQDFSEKQVKKKQRGGKKKAKTVEPKDVELISEDILLQADNEDTSAKKKTQSDKALKRELQDQLELNQTRHKRFNEIESSKPHKKSRADNFEIQVVRDVDNDTISGELKPTSSAVSFSQKLIRGGNHSRVRVSRSAFNSQQIRGAPKQFVRK